MAYSILEQVKIRLKQFHIESAENSDTVVFDSKEDNPLLEQLIDQVKQEIVSRKMYPDSYTEEKIERDNYYCKNINIDRKALSEVYMILEQYNEKDKIPKKYLWVIEDNMDREYLHKIDDVFSQILMEDTKKIITYIYTNFLSTPEERENLKALEKIQHK